MKIKVEDISFEGQGCAHFMASAANYDRFSKRKRRKEAKEIISDFRHD